VELAGSLGEAVLLPGSPPYEAVMAGLFFADAGRAQPACILQPRSAEQVAAALAIVRRSGGQATVRGGGASALCAADGAVMIDLAAHMGAARPAGESLEVGGGATMGTLLRTLAPDGRLVPVGVALVPGLGLVLRGGVGYLSRSMGLTVDHLEAVELVVPSGEVLRLSSASAGDQAELWWGVRGCGPSLGVVTAATLRTHHLPAVYLRRLVVGLDALPAFFDWAPSLPRAISASLVVGPPGARPGAPVVYVCVVAAGADRAEIRRTDQEVDGFLARSPGVPFFDAGGACPYAAIPPFDVPALPGTPATPVPEGRVYAFVKSYFLRNSLDAPAAAAVAAAIRAAPTPLCRFDFQHLGGAMGDVPRSATAFWNRDAEWNWVITGAWHGPAGEREAVVRWVREAARALPGHVAGAYSVELRPGMPETEAEVASAFGEHRPRLRALKQRWDPENVLGRYYPL
jgi:FAD/FMN-containing dehydrogenase